MKTLSSAVALMALLLLPGCGGDSDAASKNALTIDCAIEIQIAVVSGLQPGFEITDGDWRVAATCVLPVQSTGGPGHVVSNNDGAIMELKWDNVCTKFGGKRMEFGGGQWFIRNRIDRRDGVSQTLGGGISNPPLSFSTDFEWLGSCDLDTDGRSKSDRMLVIRGRVLPKAPPAQPLNLAELTNAGIALKPM